MLDTLFKRRSIRKYNDKPVEREKIETMLRAAMYAPSSHDGRPWHFVVVTDREKMDAFMAIHPYAKMLSQANGMILVCGDHEKESAPDQYKIDCAACTQNMLLAAYELKIGTCWLAVAGRPERMDHTRRIFNLPQNIEPFCAVAYGYYDQERETQERYEEYRVHENTW